MKPPANTGFFQAMAYPFRGIGFFLRHRGLWKYAFAAFTVNVALFAVFVALFLAWREEIVAWMTPEKTWAWLKAVMSCVVSIAAALVGLFLFTILGNLVAGPFLDAMTERTLALQGESLPPPRGFFAALGRSVVNQALKLLFFGAFQAALLLLLVTPLAFVHPIFSGLLTVLFLAFEYLDYPLDARRVPVPARFSWLFDHLRPALGFGSLLFLFLWIPFVGYLALPLAVCGAALLAHDIDGAGSMG